MSAGIRVAKKTALDREVRALLGRQLREYCDDTQHGPVSERLAELLERFAHILEEQESRSE